MAIFDQPLDELVSRVKLVCEVDLLSGQERARFDREERRGQNQEVASHLNVELFEVFEVLHVALNNRGDLYVLDLHLLLTNEVQQEVHRTMKDSLKAHSEALGAHSHTPPVIACRPLRAWRIPVQMGWLKLLYWLKRF